MGNSKRTSQFLGFFFLCTVASATNLPSSVQCNSSGCIVTYFQGTWLDRTSCKAASAVYPINEEQLIHSVAYAAKRRIKVKLVSEGSHSFTKLVCPDGEEGLIISTQDYNSQILINATAMTVTADAGVELRDLIDKIAESGLTLPHTPYWEGVSVAGLISTGSHGSGLWGKGSAVHDYVVGIRLITPATEAEGYATVVDLTTEDEDLDAARLSLGVLGAISQVTFQLEPMFKRSVRVELRADDLLEDEIVELARDHEFGSLNWYPASRKALFRMEDRVSVETEGDGAMKSALVDAMDVTLIELLRSEDEMAEKKRDADSALCAAQEELILGREKLGDGLVNLQEFTHYPVVGYNHRMQTAGGCQRSNTPLGLDSEQSISPTHSGFDTSCEEAANLIQKATIATPRKPSTCIWNPLIKGFFTFDTAITIPLTLVPQAILDIKKLHHASPHAMCSFTSYGGIFVRFLKASTAYLGEQTDCVMFEIMYYRSREPNEPRANEDVYEEIEQMLIKKYRGKPHWGKNRNLVFEDMHSRTTNLPKFLSTRQKFDPIGIFSSEWTESILGMSTHSNHTHIGHLLQDHCALEGLCICSQDSHCHPSKGYYCRQGYVFKEARVCRYEDFSMYSK